MAIRTISNLGGNYNATATWVEGVVPTSADDIVATATSGQLTINVGSAARTFNFTNYTNTLTMNSPWVVSGASLTNTFVSGMTIAGTGQLTISGNTTTFVSGGKTINNLNITGTPFTLGDNLNVNILGHSVSVTVNGNGNSINISQNLSSLSFYNMTSGTSSLNINFTGTGTIKGNLSGNNTAVAGATFSINFTGTQYNAASGTGLQILSANQPTNINYISGSFSSDFTFFFTHQVLNSQNTTLNFGSASNAGIKNLFVRTNGNGGFILGQDFPVENFTITGGEGVDRIFTLAGSGSIVAQNTRLSTSALNAIGALQVRGFTFNLTPGATHSFGNFGMLSVTQSSYSGVDPSIHIKSTITAGAKAAFSVSNKQSVFGGRITDVEVVGNTLYVLDSVLTRTTNINVLPQYYYAPSGGGGGGSFTFVN
jgi:hypothetical protein